MKTYNFLRIVLKLPVTYADHIARRYASRERSLLTDLQHIVEFADNDTLLWALWCVPVCSSRQFSFLADDERSHISRIQDLGWDISTYDDSYADADEVEAYYYTLREHSAGRLAAYVRRLLLAALERPDIVEWLNRIEPEMREAIADK